jgi:hypothetical protein
MWGVIHIKICNVEAHINIQNGETHTSKFKIERRASIFKWGNIFQNLK